MLPANLQVERQAPGQTRIRQPFPGLARVFGWALDTVAALLALVALISPPAQSSPLIMLLASLVIVLIGELTRTGYHEIRFSVAGRRVSGGLCTRFGRVSPLYVEGSIPPEGGIAVMRVPAGKRHTLYGLFLPRSRARSRPAMMHFHSREDAERVRDWIQDQLRQGGDNRTR